MKAIVLVLRGCPAGWLGAYGNEWVVTPNLDRLAAESVVFDRHISDCPEPSAACRSWLGGADPNDPLLTETLRAAGVQTVLLRANHPDTDAPEWFYAGWSEVFDARPQEEDLSPLDSLLRELPSVLERLATKPAFLLWIEIDRLIPPWDIPQEVFEAYLQHEGDEDPSEPAEEDDESEADAEDATEDDSDVEDSELAVTDRQSTSDDDPVSPWRDPPTGLFDTNDPVAREWLATSFGAVMTKLDAELGMLFDGLRSHELDRSATWLVTSDFGYPLGEHGQIGLYRPWLYHELVHLPLLVRLPGAVEACRRVYGFTQPPDVRNTLLDLFGVMPIEGMSLLPLARGELESSRHQAITLLDLPIAAESAIRPTSGHILRLEVPDAKREPQLFLKPDDRWEVNDVRSTTSRGRTNSRKPPALHSPKPNHSSITIFPKCDPLSRCRNAATRRRTGTRDRSPADPSFTISRFISSNILRDTKTLASEYPSSGIGLKPVPPASTPISDCARRAHGFRRTIERPRRPLRRQDRLRRIGCCASICPIRGSSCSSRPPRRAPARASSRRDPM